MDTRDIAFVAYEAARAHKRVMDPKADLPFWYDIEDPDVQVHFQAVIDNLAAGATPQRAFPPEMRADGDDERMELISAVVHALTPQVPRPPG